MIMSRIFITFMLPLFHFYAFKYIYNLKPFCFAPAIQSIKVYLSDKSLKKKCDKTIHFSQIFILLQPVNSQLFSIDNYVMSIYFCRN